MNGALRVIREHNLGGKSYKGDVFESNIPPFLRFIHKNNIEPLDGLILVQEITQLI